MPATFTWTGAVSEFWSNPANWAENRVPESGLEADIDRNDELYFPQTATRYGSVNDIKGTVHAAEVFIIGNYGISGGTVRLDSSTGLSEFSGGSVIGFGPIWGVNLELSVGTRLDVGSDEQVQLTGILSGPGGVLKGSSSGVLSGTFSLNAHNTYTGLTVVEDGILEVGQNDSLGATAAGTSVSEHGTLKLRSSTAVGQESLSLGGTLLAASGSPSWAGPIDICCSIEGRIRVDGVSSNLTLSGPVSGLARLIKDGTGTLVFAGADANSYTGATEVHGGRLDLNKTAGVHAVIGSVFVGINASSGFPSGSGELRLLNDNQIPNTVALSIGPSDLLNLNGRSDTVGELTLLGGRVTTGVGTLTLNGNVIATSIIDPSGTQESVAALVEGKLALGSATRFFTVEDGPAKTDVTVAAVISGTGALAKNGIGALRLSANNSYTGATTINAGLLVMDGDQPSSPVEVKANSTLAGSGSIGPLTVGSDGVVRPGDSLTVTGNATFGGFKSAFQPFVGTVINGLGATGTLNLNNATLNILDVNVPGGLPPLGVPLPVAGAASVIGLFNGLPQNAIAVSVSGLPYRVTYSPNQVLITRLSGPAFPDRAITPVIDEGGVATLTGRITTTEPGDKFFLEVNWGDGTRTEIHKVNPDAPRSVALNHRYLDDGIYTVGLLWRDQRGAFNTGTLQITVRNLAPTVFAGADLTLGRGGVLTRHGQALDSGPRDLLIATVDYGDGSGVQPLPLSKHGHFVLHHRYSQPGEYVVAVTVQDDDGGGASDSFRVTVIAGHDGDDGGDNERIRALDVVLSNNLQVTPGWKRRPK